MYGYDHGIIIYPLVNVYKKLWKDPPFFMGISLFLWPFSIAKC